MEQHPRAVRWRTQQLDREGGWRNMVLECGHTFLQRAAGGGGGGPNHQHALGEEKMNEVVTCNATDLRCQCGIWKGTNGGAGDGEAQGGIE
jgi:hypothetical protein